MRTPARARASTTANLFIEHSVPVPVSVKTVVAFVDQSERPSMMAL
jgi:hypothetical protein